MMGCYPEDKYHAWYGDKTKCCQRIIYNVFQNQFMAPLWGGIVTNTDT